MPPLAPLELLFELERATNAALEGVDRALADLRITAAGWRILRTLARAPAAQPVSRVAAVLGLRRQSVQRVVDDLVEDGILEVAPNPHHRRAKLLIVSPKGRELFSLAVDIEHRLANDLDSVLPIDRVKTILKALVSRTGVASELAPTTGPPPHAIAAGPEPLAAEGRSDSSALSSLLQGKTKAFLVGGGTVLFLQARVLATAPGWANVLRRFDGAEFALEPASEESFGEPTPMAVVGLSPAEAIELIDSGRMPALEPLQKTPAS